MSRFASYKNDRVVEVVWVGGGGTSLLILAMLVG
ncbi:hypothetical protein Pyrfu_0256 [Pyrolobus fumarii 1A]|uniref:Uncharacterized protein n=1 Tax=Pyrolobus fumarii (strain DSM 11204 / 1A) TaxID=694429 RepID=G0EF85_PYRF1|nr:hypothetical protein Pyrfu_0256 [Pyrolobus fumarii 1A]